MILSCVHCNKEFNKKIKTKLYCSERCARLNYRKRLRNKKRFKQRICKVCTNTFIPASAPNSEPSKPLEKYCSDRCKQSALRAQEARQSHKRRGKLKGGDLIDLYVLAEKEKWICALCSIEIDKENKHKRHNTNKLGPSIDHIIPLSKGGLHTWENVQLAHLICNAIRGNSDISSKA